MTNLSVKVAGVCGRSFLTSLSDTFYIFNSGSGPDKGHETALELVSGANFEGMLHHFSSPTRWNGSRGQVRPETCPKPKTQVKVLLPILNEDKQKPITITHSKRRPRVASRGAGHRAPRGRAGTTRPLHLQADKRHATDCPGLGRELKQKTKMQNIACRVPTGQKVDNFSTKNMQNITCKVSAGS